MDNSVTVAHELCFRSFVHLVSAVRKPVRDFQGQIPLRVVVEEFDKYNLWAGNVGANSKHYETSLDYRLRDASLYKTQVSRISCPGGALHFRGILFPQSSVLIGGMNSLCWHLIRTAYYC
jgi:hypothetical protein